MSSAPYTLWAIVLIFSTIGIYQRDSASNAGEHTTALHSKGSEEIRFGEVNNISVTSESNTVQQNELNI